MKGYSAQQVFEPFELALLEKATFLVESIPTRLDNIVRCHELARAIGRVLSLPVTDGKHGTVEHSWCWTKLPDCGSCPGSILEVYSIARLPMVQLVDYSSCGNFAVLNRQQYQCYPFSRSDIRENIIQYLVNYWIESGLVPPYRSDLSTWENEGGLIE
jgi:hypothetical protein